MSVAGPAGGRVIVVFYHARRQLPLRATNLAHLSAWGRHSRHHVVYVNAAWGVPWRLLERLPVSAVVFDTIFLSMHWSREHFRARTVGFERLAGWRCPKIALPQDEFIHMDVVVAFLERVGVTHVLSCAGPGDWKTIYAGLDFERVAFRTVLTGYVDETRQAPHRYPPAATRPVAIGYRAWNNPYWLGSHGLLKVEVARHVGAAARARGLAVDINNPDSRDFLIGDAWFDFLGRCRTVLGVEGGASVFDRDGSLQAAVDAYVAAHAGASFEEVRDRCFPGRDGEIRLFAVSPRHFEAALTRTCQVLVEGEYNGVFRPWDHYIPIRKDWSNLEQVLDAVQDDDLVRRIVERTYADVVASGRWGYRRFVRDVEEDIVERAPAPPARLADAALARALALRDGVQWRWAHVEAGSRWARLQESRLAARRALSRARWRLRTALGRGERSGGPPAE